jgi:hypothetical protein
MLLHVASRIKNNTIAPEVILAAHLDRTQERLADANESVILAVQDTTEPDYSHHPHIRGCDLGETE